MLKGEADLDNLLFDMLGPEEAKKFMHDSNHASKDDVRSAAIRISQVDASTVKSGTTTEK